MALLPLDYTIATERLVLRAPAESDIELVFDASRYPGFTDGMLWDPPASLEECRAPLQEALENWRAGTVLLFMLTLAASGEPVGRIGLRLDLAVPCVGFWTHPRYQGAGYMTEALQAVARLAFDYCGAAEIEACHAEWNVASRRVLEKCGFRFRRHVEQGFRKRGEWVAEDVLSLRRRDWKAAAERPRP